MRKGLCQGLDGDIFHAMTEYEMFLQKSRRQRKRIVALWNQGIRNQSEIARRIGISRQRIAQILKAEGKFDGKGKANGVDGSRSD